MAGPPMGSFLIAPGPNEGLVIIKTRVENRRSQGSSTDAGICTIAGVYETKESASHAGHPPSSIVAIDLAEQGDVDQHDPRLVSRLGLLFVSSSGAEFGAELIEGPQFHAVESLARRCVMSFPSGGVL
ncbi:hypothetical protein N7462_007734 [Penicillium macrosclerotiorum]|uniref:uncharacterized protein n=1 Tax=Penicillium macrosclerotiorum TaxID=303699 RepID=UPI002548AC77|nr:uncharacterized protein N7462_007734 [Penicillium macrosclerotiorum]KAJ5679490.1 hypothetical protein N7462_007734 [Penicillium macrosclerotiorum]